MLGYSSIPSNTNSMGPEGSYLNGFFTNSQQTFGNSLELLQQGSYGNDRRNAEHSLVINPQLLQLDPRPYLSSTNFNLNGLFRQQTAPTMAGPSNLNYNEFTSMHSENSMTSPFSNYSPPPSWTYAPAAFPNNSTAGPLNAGHDNLTFTHGNNNIGSPFSSSLHSTYSPILYNNFPTSHPTQAGSSLPLPSLPYALVPGPGIGQGHGPSSSRTRRLSRSSTLISVEGSVFHSNNPLVQNSTMTNKVDSGSGNTGSDYGNQSSASSTSPTVDALSRSASGNQDTTFTGSSMAQRSSRTGTSPSNSRKAPYTKARAPKRPKGTHEPDFVEVRKLRTDRVCKWLYTSGFECQHDFGHDDKKSVSAHAIAHRDDSIQEEQSSGKAPSKGKFICRWTGCDLEGKGMAADAFARHFVHHHSPIRILCLRCGQALARADCEKRHRAGCCKNNMIKKPEMMDQVWLEYEFVA
ncbi:uncharacterized protein C8R40DRAFT_508278 [Lentinula edodes]|uniref:uncharacterized protein n=1 Tax=Lentinula edodes TaxID=5353 RepID=UPI001E8EDE95|nr:uncharacterized protein C8R40DRAFT_508278 [Lentinula edodes]KAH7872167.1 hypothetical protein C8R40DRAFT_508278 [Lentinula edodes]